MRTLLVNILVISSCAFYCKAQVKSPSAKIPAVHLIKGNYYFDQKNYTVAIEHYGKFLSHSPSNVHAILRIAESNQKLGSDDLAYNWYNKAIAIDPDLDETNTWNYMSLLYKIGKYEELKQWVTIYNDKVTDKLLTNDADKTPYKDSTLFILNHLNSINSGHAESGPFFYQNQLFFSSNRNSGQPALYIAAVNGENYEKPVPLKGIMSTTLTQHYAAIARKQGKLFFTGWDPSNNVANALLRLYYCDFPAPSGEVKIEELKFKKFEQGTNQIAINSEGTLIVFSSKSRENDWGYDLFKSGYNGKKWSTPELLRLGVHTSGDEMYPTLYKDSILYFSSNKPGGLGGFDIYCVNLFDQRAKVQHLDAPINSSSDDYGLSYNENGREGYLVSGRSGGVGDADLYKFYNLPLKVSYDTAKENTPRSEGFLVYTSSGNKMQLLTDNKGFLSFEFNPAIDYTLIMEHNKYQSKTTISKTNKALKNNNIYTFQVQQGGTQYTPADRSKKVEDVHIELGDLITFQLLPDLSNDPGSGNAKIKIGKRETDINRTDTIVFSYVVMPVTTSGPGSNELLAANKPDTGNEELPDDGKVDPDLDESVSLANSSSEDKAAETVADEATEAIEENTDLDKPVGPASKEGPSNEALALQEGEGPEQSDSANQPAQTDDSQAEETAADNRSVVDAIPDAADTAKLSSEAIAMREEDQQERLGPESELTQPEVDQINEIVADNTNEGPFHGSGPSSQQTETDDNALLSDEEEKAETVLPNNDLPVADNLALDSQSSGNEVPDTNQPSSLDTKAATDDKGPEFQYRIQIAASKAVMSDGELRGIYPGPNKIRSFKEDGYYKYYLGEASNYPEALQMLKECKAQQAFIAVYCGEVKWTLREAVAAEKSEILKGPGPDNEVDQTQESTIDNTPLEGPKASLANSEVPTLQSDEANQNITASTSAEELVAERSGQVTTMDEQVSGPTSASQVNEANEVNFQYRVQIAASKVAMSDNELKNIYQGPYEIASFKEDGYFKYYIAETSGYYQARSILRESNLDQAFISVYKDDTKWSLQEAIALQNEKPQVVSELAETDSLVKIETVNFNFDEFELSPAQKLHLQKYVVGQLKANKSYSVIVNGYADIRGSDGYNYGLSKERASVVEKLIIQKGIDEKRVSTQYFGESQLVKYCPKDESCDESVHQANRRVEILLLIRDNEKPFQVSNAK